MSSAGQQQDKATEQYWSSVWEHSDVARYTSPDQFNRAHREVHEFLVRQLKNLPLGTSILEVGCGNSKWLPYFAKEFGLTVAGLDYSEIGCRMAENSLAAAGVNGTIYRADLFNPPADLAGSYDIVISLGVVEHFTDTAAFLAAVARLGKSGGMVLTVLPNLSGWIGSIQKRMDRRIYDIHVPLDADQIRRAHETAGLQVDVCEYIVPLDFHMCTTESPTPSLPHKVLMKLSRLIWASEKLLGPLLPGKRTGTYIVCAARIPV
jgi:cyclopropane fatty-acyl-phospholipid synthase-like methyltransferase